MPTLNVRNWHSGNLNQTFSWQTFKTCISVTDQTELRWSAGQWIPSCSYNPLLPRWCGPVGSHSCCCHWLPTPWTETELQASLPDFNRAQDHVTQSAWLGRRGNVPLLCHPPHFKLDPSRSPPHPLFTAHYSLHFWGTGRGGREAGTGAFEWCPSLAWRPRAPSPNTWHLL